MLRVKTRKKKKKQLHSRQKQSARKSVWREKKRLDRRDAKFRNSRIKLRTIFFALLHFLADRRSQKMDGKNVGLIWGLEGGKHTYIYTTNWVCLVATTLDQLSYLGYASESFSDHAPALHYYSALVNATILSHLPFSLIHILFFVSSTNSANIRKVERYLFFSFFGTNGFYVSSFVK